jgi:hypothetical protein
MRWLVVNRDLDQICNDDPVTASSQASCVTMEQRAGTFVLVDRDGCPRHVPTLSFMI